MKKVSELIKDLLLICIIAICVLPFLYMILMSFKSTTNAYDLSISGLTIKHYTKILTDPTIVRYFLNSVIVAAAGVCLTLFTSCTAGFAFARLKFKGSDKIFLFLILTLLVPSEILLVPLYLVVRSLGWVNTFQALILPLPTAFGVFIMRQAMLAIPEELLESARIDGAGDFRILSTVILPLVKSSMLTLAIFTFLGAWNNFTWPLIITTKDTMRTLPLALTTLQAQYDVDIGLKMACSTITFLPPFIFYLFLQSKFEAGVALSGIKG